MLLNYCQASTSSETVSQTSIERAGRSIRDPCDSPVLLAARLRPPQSLPATVHYSSSHSQWITTTNTITPIDTTM